MSTWLQIVLAICGFVIAIGTLLIQYGRERGGETGDLKHMASDLLRLDLEVTNLRTWRHKIGDDPSDSVGQLYDMLEKRVVNLERKVWNGNPPRG